MRGALQCVEGENGHIGIIPADAGSTLAITIACLAWSDHPRGCGEHATLLASALSGVGSSPRMRGAQSNITKFQQVAQNAGDHPRGCGEHLSFPVSVSSVLGSSPRMRGAPPVRLPGTGTTRIIPADAGSTLRCLVQSLIF